MARDLVSVIVPTWQRAAFIDACLDAILTPSEAADVDVEVLVCDDGSTDDTRERVAARADARVRLLALPHTGLPAAVRNAGLRDARGELVAFCDSDDLWRPGHLARLLEGLRRVPDASVVSTRSRLVLPDGTCIGEHPGAVEASDDVGLRRLIAGNIMPMSGTLVRRATALAAGGFPESVRAKAVEDYGMWLALARRGKVVMLPDLDVEHARHPGSLSMNEEVRECHNILYLLSCLKGPDVPRRAVARTRSAIHNQLSRALWRTNKPLASWHAVLGRLALLW